MSPRASAGRPVAWEDAGRQISSLLGIYSAVVVTSSDPEAAASVALGIARGEAAFRRVVVADLIGDVPSLRSLVLEEDPHGVTDSFLYGVSLNKIGYAVEGSENLFVMPSGSDPLIREEILRSARWSKLAASFDAGGGLLLLVALDDTPGLAELIEQVDGAVLVKDLELQAAPSALVLARVPSPTPTLRVSLHRISARTAIWKERAAGWKARAANWKPRAANWKVRAANWKARAASWRHRRWFYPMLGVIVLVLVALSAAGLLLPWGARPARVPVAVVSEPVLVPPPTSAPAQPAPDTLPLEPPANLDDSSSAAAFTVEMMVANTAEGANLFVRKNGAALPAAAVSPVPIDPKRTTWYRVTAGAYTRRYQADSLLLALRKSGVLTDSAGSVTRTPLALVVDSVPTQGGIVDAVRSAVNQYTARGLSVYALMQDDGGALIYAGAFASAEQSSGLITTLRGAGLKPVLVFRTGRVP